MISTSHFRAEKDKPSNYLKKITSKDVLTILLTKTFLIFEMI